MKRLLSVTSEAIKYIYNTLVFTKCTFFNLIFISAFEFKNLNSVSEQVSFSVFLSET